MITLLAATTAEAAAATPGIAETIQKTFGLNGPFFIAQVINFILVIIVLKIFAFGPIQAMLEQRRIRIAEGEEKLKRIEKQLAESEQTTAAAIAKAIPVLPLVASISVSPGLISPRASAC